MMISDTLRTDLISPMGIEPLFQKHVVDGSSYYFRDVLRQSDLEYEFRYELARSLDVSLNDVVIVGSAKLGFSLKSTEFRKFDAVFEETKNPREKSDVDIAVINQRYYEKTIEEIFHLSRHFEREWIDQNWKVNVFNRNPTNLHKQYALYLARGWLRPDLFPATYYENASWRPICDAWYKRMNFRRTSIGFYSSWMYLKHYQMDNLERLRTQLYSLENKYV